MNKIANSMLAFSATLALSLLVSAPSFADTDNDVFSPEETMCDGLLGRTPGLYGLCLAYCATPLDSTQEIELAVNGEELPIPNAKLLANYNKKKKEEDPQMPCATRYDETACPAWTSEQLSLVGTRVPTDCVAQIRVDDGYTEGVDGNTTTRTLYDHERGYRVRAYECDTGEPTDELRIVSAFAGVEMSETCHKNRTDGVIICSKQFAARYDVRTRTRGFSDGIWFDDFPVDYNWITDMTAAQYGACEDEIRAHRMPPPL
jgi:hypothetical protein